MEKDGVAKISMHDLRRSFAKNIANKGISPKVLKELVGYSKLEKTMKYYVNADIEEKRKAIKIVTIAG